MSLKAPRDLQATLSRHAEVSARCPAFLAPGLVVMGRYTVESLVGKGGMSTVFRARDRNGSSVALKVLCMDREDLAERFAREAHLLMEIQHPAIVRCLGHGRAPAGQPVLVMEWLEGMDLQTRLTEGRLSFEESLALAGRIAWALVAVHAHGIVHRDVKPGNIFLPGGRAREAMLLDFGVAHWGAATTLTAAGTQIGTPQYMAPEQIRGERHIDGRVDVFSLGCVLYECLCGEPAFSGHHPMAVFYKILLEDTPRISRVVQGVPEPVARLLDRMLAKEPTSRLADAAEVATMLDRVQSSLPRCGGALAPMRMSTASDVITEIEQHLVSVVLVGADPAHPGGEAWATDWPGAHVATLDSTSLDEQADTIREACPAEGVRARYELMGARFDSLADGALIAVLDTRRAASDQAEDAARCALALHDELPGRPIAVATGRAVAGQARWLGEVIERGVALLATGEPAADAPAIRIDDVTAGLVCARFWIDRDARGPVLVGEHHAAPVPRLLGRATPFVGRRQEMAALVATLEECIDEQRARAVLVTGPAGIGKSRLAHELMRVIFQREERIAIWRCSGGPVQGHASLSLMAQAVRQLAGIREAEPLDRQRRKLRARVARSVPPGQVSRVAAFLGELVHVPWPDEDDVQLRAARRDARLMGDQIRRACIDLLAADTRARPVVLILEDLHWSDQATVDLLDLALRNLTRHPLLIVALGRAEVHTRFPGLWASHDPIGLHLRPLSKHAAGKLVHAVLGETLGEDRIAELLACADGNPFHLEELVRHAASGRSDFPDTVLAMVHAELQARPADQRRVLRAASIFGNRFWPRGLLELLGADLELSRTLQALAEDELILEVESSMLASEIEYRFRHDLIREAAYGMLTETDRQRGHQAAGEWLAQEGEAEALVIAEHFERGHAPDRALPFLVRASENACEAGDFTAALSIAERGITCGAEDTTLGVLRLVQARAHKWRGDVPRLIACCEEALAMLQPGTRSWYDAAEAMWGGLGEQGDVDTLEDFARSFHRGCLPEDDRTGWLIQATTLSMCLLVYGRRTPALDLQRRIEAELGRCEKIEPVMVARVYALRAIHALILDGNPADCLLQMRTAASYFREAGDLRNACTQQGGMGFAELQLGLYRDAEATLREVLATARQMALDETALAADQNLSLALAYQGSVDEACEHARNSALALERRGNLRLAAASQVYLAKIFLLAGDPVQAETEACAALALSPARSPDLLRAQAVLARVLLARGQASEALELAGQAAHAMYERGGIEEDEALILLVHAEALRATGHSEHARQAIATARARLLERAARIEDPAWRQSFLENVPEHARTLELAQEWT